MIISIRRADGGRIVVDDAVTVVLEIMKGQPFAAATHLNRTAVVYQDIDDGQDFHTLLRNIDVQTSTDS